MIFFIFFCPKGKLRDTSGPLKSAKPVFGIFVPNSIFKCFKKKSPFTAT